MLYYIYNYIYNVNIFILNIVIKLGSSEDRADLVLLVCLCPAIQLLNHDMETTYLL